MDSTKPIRKDLEKFLKYGGLNRGDGYTPLVLKYQDPKAFFKLLARDAGGGIAIAQLDAQVNLLNRLEEAGMLKEEEAKK